VEQSRSGGSIAAITGRCGFDLIDPHGWHPMCRRDAIRKPGT
jgi:hypothetical protein